MGDSPRRLSAKVLAMSGAAEAQDLSRLLKAAVPVAESYFVDLPADAAVLRRAVDLARTQGPSIQLLPLYPDATAVRLVDVPPEGDVEARLDALLEALQAPAMRRAGGVKQLRIVGCEPSPRGGATSADRERGDPDELHVWSGDVPQSVWRIDRRSARVAKSGAALDVRTAEAVADLVDRVQLALGAPVQIRWCVQRGGRPCVLSVQPLELHPTFIAGSWSRLALVAADEGTVAPLSIDALDRALGIGGAPEVEPAVRRFYARPYRRRRGEPPKLGRREPGSFAFAAAGVARVTAEAAPILADALRFERALSTTMERLDGPPLTTLASERLVEAVRERHRIVAEALLLLDRCREVTRRALEALEAVVGPLPRDCYPALAAPRSRRTRRRSQAELVRLRERIEKEHGNLVDPSRLSPATRARWEETKRKLADLRPLGIDVTPLPIGHDDATLLEALDRVPRFGHVARERAREEAGHRVAETARARSLGRPRAALTTSLTVLLQRIARAKGGVAEGVAAALLRLRRAACEVGRRLVEQAVLDRPDDALYLSLAELEEAFAGEPGAYAARVRFRREDDQRWVAYDAPRRIGRG